MGAGEQSGWVVGQDKGNAPLYRANAGFSPAPHDFSTRQSAVHAVLYRAFGTSPYRASLQKLFYRAKPTIFVLMMLAAGTVLTIIVGEFLQLRITLTDSSAPAGVYREVNVPATRGVLVAACLPENIARQGVACGYLRGGDCPAAAEPVAKVLGAVSGDVVDIEPERVVVNGVQFPNSRTAVRDSRGRPLTHMPWGVRRVGSGAVWLFGFNNARSWDGRYFGAVPSGNVKGVLEPVITW